LRFKDTSGEKALAAAIPTGDVTLCFFDVEAFNARVSDVAVFEAVTPQIYHFAIERLPYASFFNAVLAHGRDYSCI
jgi:hypothetical protein